MRYRLFRALDYSLAKLAMVMAKVSDIGENGR